MIRKLTTHAYLTKVHGLSLNYAKCVQKLKQLTK